MGIVNRIIKIASSYATKSSPTETSSQKSAPKVTPKKTMNSTIENDPLAKEIDALFSKKQHQKAQTNQQPKQEQQSSSQKTQKLTRKEALSILNIQHENPTNDQIKSAYKRLLMVYHPDRVQHLSTHEQKIAEQKTILINLAYSTLL